MRRTWILSLLVLLALAVVATPALAKKKKKRGKRGEPAAKVVGPVKVGDWTCYAPPDFGALNPTKRGEARQTGYEFVEQLVTGKQVEGFKITSNEAMIYFETAFLGRPQLLDTWLAENFERCKAVGEGKASSADYLDYLTGIGRKLEANECYKPLTYEYHNFLEISTGWQYRLHVCKDNRLLIESTNEANGKYTIKDAGKWKKNTYILADGIVVAAGLLEKGGDQVGQVLQAEAGELGLVSDMPLGALLMRFESEDDSYTKYYLIGLSTKFHAPDHGYLSFAVNDTTYYDNTFHNVRGAIDYLGLDIYPPADEDTVSGGLMP
jgi:hypothetical protein